MRRANVVPECNLASACRCVSTVDVNVVRARGHEPIVPLGRDWRPGVTGTGPSSARSVVTCPYTDNTAHHVAIRVASNVPVRALTTAPTTPASAGDTDREMTRRRVEMGSARAYTD